jgi:alpha-mannosidase
MVHFGDLSSMKILNIICINHMDLLWRRCFEDHFSYRDNIIRPYADLEELIFDRWLEIVSHSDLIYGIEQTATIRKYLERNPDQSEKIRKLIQDHRIYQAGGGETIIDTNVVDGESIVRNHFYSILWCRHFAGVVPEQAIAHDTFGLSAQLPQIFRQFGYSALLGYQRVFKNARSFWQGLNGDLIFMKQEYANREVTSYTLNGETKLVACASCKGNGCIICEYTGFDLPLEKADDIRKIDHIFANFASSNAQAACLKVTIEEPLISQDFHKFVLACAQKHDIRVEYGTPWDLASIFGHDQIDRLIINNVDQNQIDIRKEGNPVFTGCYLSRIELKKLNRRLEDLLVSSEKFAVFASMLGMEYPQNKFGCLWNDMAIFQFHDSITSSHCDACYQELLKYYRNISFGAGRIYWDAMKTIEENISVPEKSGYQSFVLYNPLNWPVSKVIFEVILNFDRNLTDKGIMIVDANGEQQQIVGILPVENRNTGNLVVRFTGATLPSVGYQVFYYQAIDQVSSMVKVTDTSIDNEYYRIEFDASGITGIYDKDICEYIMLNNAGDLQIEEDIGSPWGTLVQPFFRDNLFYPDFNQAVVAPDNHVDLKVHVGYINKTVQFSGQYVNPSRNINQVLWVQEITLYSGIKKIYFKTTIDWDAENNRIKVTFPLNFKTTDDEAIYEIPFGLLKRKAYSADFCTEMQTNGDWPALNLVACRNERKDYSVFLINKGLPCHKVHQGVVHLGLLRSPTVPIWAMDINGAKDSGRHTFEYMISSCRGNASDGHAVQMGKEFNTDFLSCRASVKTSLLEPKHSFISNNSNNILFSAIKRSESGQDLIVRAYEAYGDEVIDGLNTNSIDEACETNLLEDEIRPVNWHHLKYRPFEIKTLKLGVSSKSSENPI